MINMIKIENYGNYQVKNYGTHTLLVQIGPFNFWYSYETIVAYQDLRNDLIICCENVYSHTTGKHLNLIESDKTKRIKEAEFNTGLKSVLAKINSQLAKIHFM